MFSTIPNLPVFPDEVVDNPPPIQESIQPVTKLVEIQSSLTPDELQPPPLPSLTSLLDEKLLERVKYRRTILNWRDESVVKLGSVGRDALNHFITHVYKLLDNITTLQRIFPDPVNEVLLDKFEAYVQAKIRIEAKKINTSLIDLLTIANHEMTNVPLLHENWPKTPSLRDCGFKPGNRYEITSNLRDIVMGKQGIVPIIQNRIIKITDELIEEK